MNLKQVVPLGFGVVFGVGIITTLLSEVSTNQLFEANQWVSHTYEVKNQLTTLEEAVTNALTGERGYLLSGNQKLLQPYQNAKEEVNLLLPQLKEEVADNPTQLDNIAQLETLLPRYFNQLEQSIERRQRTVNAETQSSLYFSQDVAQLAEDIRSQIQTMLQIEEDLLEEQQAEARRIRVFVRFVSWGGLLVVLVVGAVLVWWINQFVVQSINDRVNAIVSSSSQIAAIIEQQERTLSQQAASVNETTTTMDELSSSSQQSSKQAESASQAAQQALNLAEEGNQAVSETVHSMEELRERVEAIAEQIVRLSEQTAQIGNISQLVSDIANRTNMLALNAAVEAVRAGESGQGFSVVATEIRKLADQSKQSAERINSLVQQVQTSINSTVMVTETGTKTVESGMQVTQKTTEAFEGVTDAVNNVVLSNQQIVLNIKQQAVAVQQVLEAMNQINTGASESAQGISQTQQGTQQLNQAAKAIQALISSTSS
ncbi:methyl-accepting chemotaxis protein [Spirulina sp. CS-785/01]|uniref:methyl-accepting chemotaxis protein n=1 Tax=Spirulina sp. CS-785/01 TaxID=3021716 RepID=UPI00232B320E|nr:methyl-accepting chemotaxis protein [Spirulina sp. CS-785/01]MDB9315761.1 methyl-accepting chemotaxis protein [Spirulina sp. CS-785/01]